MPIKIIHGDIFKSECQTIVNCVNCLGASGAGIALMFKRAYPHYAADYRRHCNKGEIRIGQVLLYKPPADIALANPKWILNFPTKDDWRKPSHLGYVRKGLEHLIQNYKVWGITSIAVPALGCGKGNLAFSEVEPIMIQYLSLMDIPVELYPPH
jgi:O-acetyl-ADP-ribose deacetylase (regulator of RNase III)